MRKKTAAFLLICLFLWVPVTAAAAPFNISFSVTRPDEGIWFSELTYNGEVIWKIQVLSDGAKPVSGGSSGQTTIIVPDIVHGMFSVKVDRQ